MKDKEYLVTMRMVTIFQVGVTAKSKREAVEIAQRADLERFTEDIDSTSYTAELTDEPHRRCITREDFPE
jgi:hypothetical protein